MAGEELWEFRLDELVKQAARTNEQLQLVVEHLAVLNGSVAAHERDLIGVKQAGAKSEENQTIMRGAVHSLEMQTCSHEAADVSWKQTLRFVLEILTLLVAIAAIVWTTTS